ncbi:MAG: tyrosine-protein phosphatase [Phycisphaerae bacterium]|nr:tyrosine-protein phosphatase [Phycisphaerae bacterium]
MARRRVRTLVMVLALVGVAGLGSGLAYRLATDMPKRFGVVTEGHLYRSGDVTPTQLGRLKQRYGVGRVICLLNAEAPETIAEREAARGLGIEWQNIPLTGDGASTPEDRVAILTLLLDEAASPTLVHCAAGANRTGLAIGLYRIHHDGWDYERVLAEMKDYGFEDLPKHANLRSALTEAATAARTSSAPTGAGAGP